MTFNGARRPDQHPALADSVAPIYAVLATPLGRLYVAVTEIVNLRYMREESNRLREENEKLRRWQTIALAAAFAGSIRACLREAIDRRRDHNTEHDHPKGCYGPAASVGRVK